VLEAAGVAAEGDLVAELVGRAERVAERGSEDHAADVVPDGGPEPNGRLGLGRRLEGPAQYFFDLVHDGAGY